MTNCMQQCADFFGIKPVNAAHDFSTHHKLSVWYKDVTLTEVCAVRNYSLIKPSGS